VVHECLDVRERHMGGWESSCSPAGCHDPSDVKGDMKEKYDKAVEIASKKAKDILDDKAVHQSVTRNKLRLAVERHRSLRLPLCFPNYRLFGKFVQDCERVFELSFEEMIPSQMAPSSSQIRSLYTSVHVAAVGSAVRGFSANPDVPCHPWSLTSSDFDLMVFIQPLPERYKYLDPHPRFPWLCDKRDFENETNLGRNLKQFVAETWEQIKPKFKLARVPPQLENQSVIWLPLFERFGVVKQYMDSDIDKCSRCALLAEGHFDDYGDFSCFGCFDPF